MSGFVRRFSFVPGVETISQIEGVVIVDLPPPGAVEGISTGVVGLVGEFPDMTYATAVSSTGTVSTKATPVEVYSSQDMIDKVGGFDPTLGKEGDTGGNGFVALRDRKFSRLVLVPVNLASAGAGRCWRDLPSNYSLTSATPCVPLSGGTVAAGREFRQSTNTVRLAKKATFTAAGHYKNAVDGVVVSAGSLVINTFTSATGGFLTAKDGGPVKKGDILVFGLVGTGSGGTYRVQTDAVSDTALVVEKMDGVAWDWSSQVAQPYRIHPATDADTGGMGGVSAKLADNTGYKLPCRPTAATIAAAVTCAPTLTPPAATASTWDSLSGLKLRSNVDSGFVYSANVQAPSAANHADIDALYTTALAALLADAAPSRDVSILFTARKSAAASTAIAAALKAHVLQAASYGIGRMAIMSPNLQLVALATAISSTAPGVGAYRNEQCPYTWPGVQVFIQEAVGYAMGTADGLSTVDGILDVSADSFLASVLSNLPPERNPGEASSTTKRCLAPILAFQRSAPALGLSEYIVLKASGICAIRNDRKDGFIFQSGITSSLTSGEKNINRRRMAYFIQDSVADRLTSFAKLPLTQSLKDSVVGEIDAFLAGLLSENNPPAQRISGYLLDDVSGNTPDMEARGIFVVIGKVRTLATMDAIVFQVEAGEQVNVTLK